MMLATTDLYADRGAHPGCPSRRVLWRCARCDRLLAKIDLRPGGSAETVCSRCGAVNVMVVMESNPDCP